MCARTDGSQGGDTGMCAQVGHEHQHKHDVSTCVQTKACVPCKLLTHSWGSCCLDWLCRPHMRVHTAVLLRHRKKEHTQTQEHVCEQETGTHRFACGPWPRYLSLCLYASTPSFEHPELPKGPLGQVLRLPSVWGPILPRSGSFQLAPGPGTDLGWGLAWSTQGGPTLPVWAPALIRTGSALSLTLSGALPSLPLSQGFSAPAQGPAGEGPEPYWGTEAAQEQA